MSARKKISQREAVRNRRDLKRLREFVSRISGRFVQLDQHIATLGEYVESTALARGIQWGADEKVVLIAKTDGRYFVIGAVRIPEASDAAR